MQGINRLLRQGMFLAGSLLLGSTLVFAAETKPQFAPMGGLDCNGLSKIQKPINGLNICADFINPFGTGDERRGEDNGVYIGHDEPSLGFYSTAPRSGNRMQWLITLPLERPAPATQTYENYVTFWLSLALCDPKSFPNGSCTPDSRLTKKCRRWVQSEVPNSIVPKTSSAKNFKGRKWERPMGGVA